jgi:diadenosine tetraphosphate (Ap4A) HIT family hydrolase
MIYLYVFGGGIPHLHIHLAPHTAGDALNQAIVKGKLSERRHPSGAVIQASEDYPLLDEGELRAVAERVKDALRKEAPEIPRAR